MDGLSRGEFGLTRIMTCNLGKNSKKVEQPLYQSRFEMVTFYLFSEYACNCKMFLVQQSTLYAYRVRLFSLICILNAQQFLVLLCIVLSPVLYQHRRYM